MKNFNGQYNTPAFVRRHHPRGVVSRRSQGYKSTIILLVGFHTSQSHHSSNYLSFRNRMDALATCQLSVIRGKFTPPLQVGLTCYANAVAAAVQMALERVTGREGGIPSFEWLRSQIISVDGSDGACAFSVLRRCCDRYRPLRCDHVKEDVARSFVNTGPVVMVFYLTDIQWSRFSAFFRSHNVQILKKSDIFNEHDDPDLPLKGHAVVLMAANSQRLKMMNSWSTKFGDNGFFRVENGTVFTNTKFYRVYWHETDLLPSEREAHNNRVVTVESPRGVLPEGKCKKCEQVCEITCIPSRLCSKCFLGQKYPLSYICKVCSIPQTIHHPMWLYQFDPNQWGDTTWVCRASCSTHTHWKINPIDMDKVPSEHVPYSWGWTRPAWTSASSAV